jgi:hypothetical protein
MDGGGGTPGPWTGAPHSGQSRAPLGASWPFSQRPPKEPGSTPNDTSKGKIEGQRILLGRVLGAFVIRWPLPGAIGCVRVLDLAIGSSPS